MSSESGQKQEYIFRGIAVSPGVAHGTPWLLSHKQLEIPTYPIEEDQVDAEIVRFEASIMATRQQITNLRDEVSKKLRETEAQIYEARLLV